MRKGEVVFAIEAAQTGTGTQPDKPGLILMNGLYKWTGQFGGIEALKQAGGKLCPGRLLQKRKNKEAKKGTTVQGKRLFHKPSEKPNKSNFLKCLPMSEAQSLRNR
jgi:hypothetical protein